MLEYDDRGIWDDCCRRNEVLLRNDSSEFADEEVNLGDFVIYAKALSFEMGALLFGRSSWCGRIVLSSFGFDEAVVFNISSRVIPVLTLCECLKCCEPIGLFVVSGIFLCCSAVEYDLSSE